MTPRNYNLRFPRTARQPDYKLMLTISRVFTLFLLAALFSTAVDFYMAVR